MENTGGRGRKLLDDKLKEPTGIADTPREPTRGTVTSREPTGPLTYSEAEESEEDGGGEGSGSDSSDEEEDGKVAGLINDQSEESAKESEGENDDEEEEKRKRKKREYKDLLDEDYELLQENLGIKKAKKPRRVYLESDDKEAEEVALVDIMRSGSSMRRGGKRMDMIRPYLTQQQLEAVDEEGLYSDSDQEVETQSRSSAMQDQGGKQLFGRAMTDSEEEDDFIVDEMSQLINQKKGRDQSTDTALLEAQLNFDMEEFAQFGEDKTDYLDDEEEEEENY